MRRVALPAPTFASAQAVIAFADAASRDPLRDEKLIQAVKAEFPNVINRQLLPPEAPPPVPHLTLASTSSQLALSSTQVDFQVRFYGDYQSDLDQALEYLGRKLSAIRAGLVASDTSPSTIGLIGVFNFSGEEFDGEGPAGYILRTHLRTEVDRNSLQDAVARVGIKVRDTYFVTLTISNYEFRVLERPIMPGMQAIKVHPWEGTVNDQGLELRVDINNNLEARVQREDPVLTEDGIRAALGLLRQVAATTGPVFAESGQVSVDELVEGSQTTAAAETPEDPQTTPAS